MLPQGGHWAERSITDTIDRIMRISHLPLRIPGPFQARGPQFLQQRLWPFVMAWWKASLAP
jgi:hypothetical protein